jgi:putative SOS response-associated peptidase YedK
MCGRFQLSVKGKQISERFNIEVFDEKYTPSYNCAPSQKLPIIINTHPNKLSYFSWGLIPIWAKEAKIGFNNINARSETISHKPSFKNAFKTQRCLIPANGYYEWKNDGLKTPYRIFLKEEKIFAMAGIWEVWQDAEDKKIHTFSIITTSANTATRNIHKRMPVILQPEGEQLWLHGEDEDILQKLLIPFESNKTDLYSISNNVNSTRNNDPSIITPSKDNQYKLF